MIVNKKKSQIIETLQFIVIVESKHERTMQFSSIIFPHKNKEQKHVIYSLHGLILLVPKGLILYDVEFNQSMKKIKK